MKKYLILAFSLVILSACDHFSDPHFFLTPKERAQASTNCIMNSYQYSRFSQEYNDWLMDAISYNDKNDKAFYELANASLLKGELSTWKKYIDKAVELNPEAYKIQRGNQYLTYLNDAEKAIVDFYSADLLDSARVMHSPFIRPNLMRGIAHYRLKEYEKSISFFNDYFNEMKDGSVIDPCAYLYLSKAQYYLGNMDKSLAHINDGLDRNKNYVNFLVFKAKLLYEMKDNKAALTIEDALDQLADGVFLKEKHQILDSNISRKDLTALAKKYRETDK